MAPLKPAGQLHFGELSAMPSQSLGSTLSHPASIQRGRPDDDVFVTPMVIGSLTPRTPTCSGKGQSSATMLSSARTGGSSSTVGATVRKRPFETVFEQDAPSYSTRAHRPTAVANLSSTINVDLFFAIVETVETLEVHVPSLEAEVKSQKAVIRDLRAQIAASSKAPAAPAH
jgi:hypothetical protein